jgi:hypothetical protein
MANRQPSRCASLLFGASFLCLFFHIRFDPMKKEIIKETGISAVRSIFGAVPFAGGALNEIFFDFRSRVKQNRINSFAEMLTDFFMENSEIDTESLKTEEFSDIFESVVRRVMLTKSKEKHVRYRDILIQHVFEPHKSVENAETYLDMIATLDEMAIRILAVHGQFSIDYARLEIELMNAEGNARKEQNKIEQLKQSYPIKEDKLKLYELAKSKFDNEAKVIRQEITDRQAFRKAEYFGINDSEFLYYKQTLYSKGFLIDKGFGTFGGSTPFLRMWVTDFGQQFLNFITDQG